MYNLKENLDEENKVVNTFTKIQVEKAYYLGEYKERVLGALTKNQLIEDDVYPEIIDLMGRKEAYLLKLSREIELKKLRPYIVYAEKIGLKYELVDGLSYRGDIGLVVASDSALENQEEELIIRDMDQDFIDAGLGEIFSKNRGLLICGRHYDEVRKKLPNYTKDFKKINLLGKFIGQKCPICQAEKEHGRN